MISCSWRHYTKSPASRLPAPRGKSIGECKTGKNQVKSGNSAVTHVQAHQKAPWKRTPRGLQHDLTALAHGLQRRHRRFAAAMPAVRRASVGVEKAPAPLARVYRPRRCDVALSPLAPEGSVAVAPRRVEPSAVRIAYRRSHATAPLTLTRTCVSESYARGS